MQRQVCSRSSGQEFPVTCVSHLSSEGRMTRKLKAEDPLLPFEAEESTPLDLYVPTRRNILAMMVESGKVPEESEPDMHGESIQDDHAVAASLPVEYSAIEEDGHMDHHRKPIISVHGKDVDEHELDHKSAA